jgi:type I restriction enzyme S subunit
MAEGWAAVKLPDVCAINPPKPPADLLPPDAPVTFVPMPAVDADQGVIATPATRPFMEVRRGFTAFRNNDVIMAKITPCMENGKAAIARDLQNGLGFGSTEFHVFRSNGAVLPEYLFQYIRQESFRKAAEAEMTGSVGQKRVPVSFLEGADFPLPPLAEQKRIVAKVEELLARVNAARERLARVPAILKRFRQSVLDAACSGRLTADWRGGRKSNSDIPQGWRWVRVRSLVPPGGLFDGPFGSNLKTSDYVQSGVRVIRLENIRKLGFASDRKTYITEEKYTALRRHTVGEGDLILASFVDDEIRACVLPRLDDRAIAKADCFCLRPMPDLMDRDYFAYQLVSSDSYNRLIGEIHGATRPRVNLRQLAELEVRICPLDEQREIVRRVMGLFGLVDRVDKRLELVTGQEAKVMQAILAKAFRGELVPTEADLARAEGRPYEPSSALLARIRAEVAQPTDTHQVPQRRSRASPRR